MLRERVVMMKFDKGLMAGSGTMLVLSLLEGGDMYGYQMIEELARRSNDLFQMQEGTLYPILHGLEREGALTSCERRADTDRTRKYYHLTEKGKRLLEEKQREWSVYAEAVNRILRGGVSYGAV